MPIQMRTGDFETDHTAAEMEIFEAMDSTCPEAPAIRDRIRADQLGEVGIREAIHAEARELREAADREDGHGAHLQRHKDNGGALSAAEEKKMAAHFARAKKL